MVRFLSWNINSVRLRLPLLERLVKEYQPTIVCLQETKVQDSAFPLAAVQALGFPYVHFRGEKSYNGVAILSQHPFTPLAHFNYGQKEDARHVAVSIEHGRLGLIAVHNLYIPAGGDIPDPHINPKFAHKLQFLSDLISWAKDVKASNMPTIMMGDLNIAPLEQDVWSHRQLLNVVSHTPIETEGLMELYHAGGWVDAHRYFVPPEQKLYSWWSYRNRDWRQSDRGRRLDHVWLTSHVVPMLQSSAILKDVRGWDSPSDHVPVIVDLKS